MSTKAICLKRKPNTFNLLMLKKQRYRAFLDFLLLLIGTLWIFQDSIKWIGAAFAGMHDQFNLFLLFAIVIVIFKETRNTSVNFSAHLRPTLNPLAVFLYCITLIAYVVSKMIVDINLLSAICFGTLLYALSGFYVSSQTWKKWAIPSFLIILTLPFGNLMDTYLGFPLRIMAAEMVHEVLLVFDYQSINKETIITLENQATQINMNCSGMKGLWASWVYFFTLSWIYRLQIDYRWLVTLLFSSGVVLFFNLMRIIILVFVHLIMENKDLADMIHTPIGLIGFIFSCLLTWLVVYYWLRKDSQETKRKKFKTFSFLARKSPFLNRYATAIILIAVSLLVIFKPSEIKREAVSFNPVFTWPDSLSLNEIDLTENEKFFFAKDSCYPIKKEFTYNTLKGTFLLVFNGSFRGHHHPEVCMQGSGYSLGHAATLLIKPDFPVKTVAVNNDSLTATYWFQASGEITEDYSSRVWQEVLGRQKKWVMISILFNQTVDTNDDDYRELIQLISDQVNRNLLTLNTSNETY